MVGTFKEKPPRVEQPTQTQQAVEPDLDDEIPF
jgi:hypothetical protein